MTSECMYMLPESSRVSNAHLESRYLLGKPTSLLSPHNQTIFYHFGSKPSSHCIHGLFSALQGADYVLLGFSFSPGVFKKKTNL